jgi:hypothetical protein
MNFLENIYNGNYNIDMFIDEKLNNKQIVLLACVKSIFEILDQGTLIYNNENISLISLAINYLLKTTTIPFHEYYFIDYLANNTDIDTYLILKNLDDKSTFPYRSIWAFCKSPNNCINVLEDQADIDLCYILHACYSGLYDNPNIYFQQNFIYDVIFDKI